MKTAKRLACLRILTDHLPLTSLPSKQLISAYPSALFRSLDTPVHVVLHRLCIAVLAVHVLFMEGYLPKYLPTCVQKRCVHSSNYNPCEKREQERHRRIMFAVR